MNDLTKIFELGIKSKKKYYDYNIIKNINKETDCFCDYDDDGANWILVWKNVEKKSIVYAYISQFYPVALVMKNCPKSVIKLFKKNSIYTVIFKEPFSCDEKVLKKYARGKNILDDRFLDNCDFAIDDERLDYIYNHINYITPYNFSFEEIR